MRALAVLAALGLKAAPAASAASHCVGIPAHAEAPPVTACEYATEYAFDVAGDKFRYDKGLYRERLRETVQAWLRGAEQDPALVDGATVEVWLAVPEIAPAATQARMAIRLADGRGLVAFLPPRLEEWTLEDAGVGMLAPGEAYPQSYGARARSVLVERAAGADPATFRLVVEGLGALEPEPFSGAWHAARTAAFEERAVAARLEAAAEAKGVVASAAANALFEWIATRERVFAFSFPEP